MLELRAAGQDYLEGYQLFDPGRRFEAVAMTKSSSQAVGSLYCSLVRSLGFRERGEAMGDPAERCGPVETCSDAHRGIIDAVHAIHKGALPNDITPNLTADYYAKIIRLMSEPENGVLGIAHAQGIPVAFCFTALDPHQFSDKIARERWLLLKSISRFALSRPDLLIDLAGAALGKSRIAAGETTTCPEIYVICVGDGHRSQGIGAKLLNHAVDHVRRCGCSAITVKTSDARALAFYERQGFKRVGEQNRFNRKLAILKREI